MEIIPKTPYTYSKTSLHKESKMSETKVRSDQSVYDIASQHFANITYEIKKNTTDNKWNELIDETIAQDIIISGKVYGKVFEKITKGMIDRIRSAMDPYDKTTIATFSTRKDDQTFIKMLAEYPHRYTNFQYYYREKGFDHLEGKILYRNVVSENEKNGITIIANASEIITKSILDRIKASEAKYVPAADIISKNDSATKIKSIKNLPEAKEQPQNTIAISPKYSKAEKQSRGRPQEHNESWSKITVTLLDKQIHWLDQLASNIRFNTKVAISRTELIQAIIAAAEESSADLSRLKNKTEIKDHLLTIFKQ